MDDTKQLKECVEHNKNSWERIEHWNEIGFL